MTKTDWIVIARALGDVRAATEASWSPEDAANQLTAHDRKLMHFSRLAAIDQVAMALARALKGKAVRFDEAVFFRVVGGKR